MTALRILPFTALVPTRDFQQRIPTYGSGKRPQSELETLAKEEVLSYIRIVKPQFLNPAIEQGTDQFYEASKYHLDQLILAGALTRLDQTMFLYEQLQPGIAPLRGVVLAVAAENCADGTVKKHENVIQSKAGRLVKHIDVLNSISEPVLLTQKLPANIKDWLHTTRTVDPLVETKDALGFIHRLWPLSEDEQSLVVEGFGKLDSLYIADGHHRVAAVTQYLQQSGKSEQQGLMSLVMDQDDLLIKSFHRIISGCGVLDVGAYFSDNGIPYCGVSLDEEPVVQANESMVMTASGCFVFSLGESNPAMNAVEKLEVTRVESGIIRNLIGIENTSHDGRISFMRGDTPLQTMKSKIEQGECDCVFVLPANSFDQVEAVADQNLTMPPKSTWIEPKLLTGFVTQQFD